MKGEKMQLPGCPPLMLYHTTLGTIYNTFDKRAQDLKKIISQDIHEDKDLLPTLAYLEHQNAKAMRDLNERVELGGCKTWLQIGNKMDHQHPTKFERGLFARRIGELLYEYTCRILEVPIAETPVCFKGIPVLVRGSKFMVNMDSRVLTPHLVQQPCNGRYPVTLKTTSLAWVTVGSRVIQVDDPKPLHSATEYHLNKKISTLYTTEELKYHLMPSFQHS